MLKALKRLFQQEKEKYRIPRKVQDLIPINCVWKDGIFLCNQKYSMCYRFTDINYQVASGEDQLSMIGLYRNILNGLDTTGTGKITVYPHRMNRFDFEESVLWRATHRMSSAWNITTSFSTAPLVTREAKPKSILQSLWPNGILRKPEVISSESPANCRLISKLWDLPAHRWN